jgi:BirA family biotin operon repressor/biotin-[acetyl-CoA-carboxylase] ligase
MLALWRGSAPEAFAQAWLARAHPVGSALNVHVSAHETVSGKFVGIEPDGALRLLAGDGREVTVRAGDVELG